VTLGRVFRTRGFQRIRLTYTFIEASISELWSQADFLYIFLSCKSLSEFLTSAISGSFYRTEYSRVLGRPVCLIPSHSNKINPSHEWDKVKLLNSRCSCSFKFVYYFRFSSDATNCVTYTGKILVKHLKPWAGCIHTCMHAHILTYIYVHNARRFLIIMSFTHRGLVTNRVLTGGIVC